MTQNRYILTLSCPDAPNIVAAVTQFISSQGGFITESAQFGDASTERFFLRCEFTMEGDEEKRNEPVGEPSPEPSTSEGSKPEQEAFIKAFAAIATQYDMDWQLYDTAHKARILIAITKESHCLGTILNRVESGSLPIDIVGVVSNHETLRSIAERNGLPYHYLPVTSDTKQEQEAQLLSLMEQTQADTLVLARYMQILSNATSDALRGRAINIHHSFLPGFKGANPYAQAYDRGVKLIGATAHYVTADLDEGPIIEQEVIRVSHHHGPETLKNFGQDIESQVLLRALTYHTQHRVLLNGNKTVVFV